VTSPGEVGGGVTVTWPGVAGGDITWSGEGVRVCLSGEAANISASLSLSSLSLS
jgi:hypothetical protein